jgi:hypothetical protein
MGKKRAKNGKGKGVGVFQGVGAVEEGMEDQDQQARSKENEERLPSAPSGSPMGEGEVG